MLFGIMKRLIVLFVILELSSISDCRRVLSVIVICCCFLCQFSVSFLLLSFTIAVADCRNLLMALIMFGILKWLIVLLM
jgi:hypothetical protein